MSAADPTFARSCDLITRARILAFALRGVDGYLGADRLERRLSILWAWRDLLRDLDRAAVNSVRHATAAILGAAHAEHFLAEQLREASAVKDEGVFRGL